MYINTSALWLPKVSSSVMESLCLGVLLQIGCIRAGKIFCSLYVCAMWIMSIVDRIVVSLSDIWYVVSVVTGTVFILVW